MAVYDRSYTRWEGDRNASVSGVSVIAAAGIRQGVANFFKRKVPAVLVTLLSFAVFLGGMILIIGRYYIMSNPEWADSELAQDLFADEAFNRMTQVNGQSIYLYLIQFQSLWAGIACIAMGSGLIANDKRTNALELYLSRPVSIAQYLFGKFWAVGFFVALVTLVPAVLLVLTQLFVSIGIEGEVPRLLAMLAKTIAAGAVVVTVPSLLILALSSMARQARGAAIMLLSLVFLLDIVLGSALQEAFGNDNYFLFSILFNIKQTVAWVLGADLYLQEGMSPATSAAIIVGWCVLCITVILRRVRPVEVVG